MGNVKNVKLLNNNQTYDLGVNHPNHQFYLSNGILTSNSHAISYSLVSYQTAYLKAHYPLEFLTANLMFEVGSNSPKAEDNVLKIKNEIKKRNVKILPPDINSSEETYIIVNDNTLMTGLDALKYMGKDAIPEIVNNRPYKDLDDLLTKVDGRKVQSRAIQAMAASGCLDSFGITRKQIFLYAGDYKKKLEIWNKRRPGEKFEYPWPDDIGEWTIPQKYAMELFYLGEGLCCGITEAYPDFFTKKAIDLSTLPTLFPDTGDPSDRYDLPASRGIIQGVVRSYFEFKVKKETSKIFGQMMAKVDIEDPYGNTIAMTLFPSGLDIFNDRLKLLGGRKMQLEPGIAVHCACSLNWYEGNLSLIFQDLKRVAPIPQLPSDIKPKKVTMKITSRKRKKTNKIDQTDFLNKIEDELSEDGIN